MIRSVGYFLYVLIQIYGWIVLLRIFASWFAANPSSPFMRRLRQATDPALNFTRRLCPLTLGGLDFSPVILLLFLFFAGSFCLQGSQALAAGTSAMVLLPVFFYCLLEVVKNITMLLLVIMAARAVLSLMKPNPYNPLALIVYGATEPLLAPLRNWFPKGPWGLDLRAVLFIAFLLIFYAVVLQNFQLLTATWAHAYGFGGR
ncbi:MAG: YggT family protein [Deltaproteobacteria bacterium]|jgi:YggT family protein|nr:YggT family protein [Deltaproteobacteria bacterium]